MEQMEQMEWRSVEAGGMFDRSLAALNDFTIVA